MISKKYIIYLCYIRIQRKRGKRRGERERERWGGGREGKGEEKEYDPYLSDK